MSRQYFYIEGIFEVIDVATDKLSLISDKIINGIAGAIEKVFKNKKKKEKKEIEEED